jgi:hypothetical protein
MGARIVYTVRHASNALVYMAESTNGGRRTLYILYIYIGARIVYTIYIYLYRAESTNGGATFVSHTKCTKGPSLLTNFIYYNSVFD